VDTSIAAEREEAAADASAAAAAVADAGNGAEKEEAAAAVVHVPTDKHTDTVVVKFLRQCSHAIRMGCKARRRRRAVVPEARCTFLLH
jgi:hypothetical protein